MDSRRGGQLTVNQSASAKSGGRSVSTYIGAHTRPIFDTEFQKARPRPGFILGFATRPCSRVSLPAQGPPALAANAAGYLSALSPASVASTHTRSASPGFGAALPKRRPAPRQDSPV